MLRSRVFLQTPSFTPLAFAAAKAVHPCADHARFQLGHSEHLVQQEAPRGALDLRPVRTGGG
ncbi:hypothetical protein [Bradyrhizobium sp. JYMT SZCCT0428]|uniref:hypothetical protein n=1 Tax=Bradyrhizobium sp. JYMT SZCCT0428 TaxID=2807673 RepID=UPI001BA7D912|nr:hypothetical protein [Bradyrhizobium sp. JYMT SZCCT0428]MBR1156946.1 hypothetical protein [Bradyrhizobium sp. JYMT SZCCT0428]